MGILGDIGEVAGGIGSLVGGIGGLFGRSNESLKAAKWTAAYNHPVEQMKRLRQAGLNPNLVYGSGAGTVAGNTQMSAEAQSNDIFSRAGRAGQSLAQMANLAQLQSVKAQTRLTNAQADREEKENRLLGDNFSRDDPAYLKLFSRHGGILSSPIPGPLDTAKYWLDQLGTTKMSERIGSAAADVWNDTKDVVPVIFDDLFKRTGREGPRLPPPALKKEKSLPSRMWKAVKAGVKGWSRYW
nr:MAG: DNA pilot protein [Microvirus sp.]